MKLICLSLLLLLSITSSKQLVAEEPSAKLPNILWIITDDQRPDSLSCYNQAVRGEDSSELGFVSSPNVEKLAEQGVLFTRAYCNSPACAPSRGSMITGRYPFRSGIYGFEQTHNRVSTFKPVVPEVMSDRGYHTALFGKSGYYIFDWGPGLTWNDIGFWDFDVDAKNDLQKNGLTDHLRDTRRAKVDGKIQMLGTEERFYYPDGTVKAFLVDEADSEEAKKGATSTPQIAGTDKQLRAAVEKELDILYTVSGGGHIVGGQSPQPPEKTLDGCTVAEFKRFLDHSGRSYETAWGLKTDGPSGDKPVFLNLGFHFPHTPVLPPKKFRDAFAGQKYQVPQFSLDELKVLPRQLQILHEKNRFDDLTPVQKQQAIRDYYAFCAFGDDLVGQAVDNFKAFSRKQDREYLIVYVCGDHSWHLGEQGIEAKFGPYDQSNHDAVIVVSSDPEKFPAGTVRDEYIEFVDFAPTFYTAAGLDVTQPEFEHLDGQPLQQVALGKGKHRDYVLGEMNHVYGPRAYLRCDDFAFSMRTREKNGKPGDPWGHPPGEGVRWALQAPREAVEMALFDLRVDPHERWNVADDPKYAPLADWFRSKLGNIVLGDRRLEVDWSKENEFQISDFARGADDKQLSIPTGLVLEK